MSEPAMMRAVLFHAPRDLRLTQIPIPRAARDGIVVKVHTALTCGTDFKAYRQGHPVLLARTPSPFGHEIAGTISEVGAEVRTIREGERVVVLNSAPCDRCYFCEQGLTELCDNLELLNGGYADYIRVPAQIVRHNVHSLRGNLGFAEAALTEPFACAVHAVDKMQMRPNETVVIIGAGNMARLLICALKAARARILVMGRNPERLHLALAAGADEVIDLTAEPDAVAAVRQHTDRHRGADAVIEAVGNPEMWQLAVGMVRKGGRVCLFGGCAAGSRFSIDTHKVHYEEIDVFGVFHHRPAYVRQALDLLGRGAVPRELLIDRDISLEELIPFFAANITSSPLKAAVVM